MATIKEIRKAFYELPKKEQDTLLKDIYAFSKDMKAFLNMRLLGSGGDEYIEKITKATQSPLASGAPKMIKVMAVNSILSSAKKSKISRGILCEMEWIAFDGYMTFLNDYGGGPDSYENRVYIHLENYLSLLMNIHKDEELEDSFEEVKIYLRKHTNMYYDHIWGLFKSITGRKVIES